MEKIFSGIELTIGAKTDRKGSDEWRYLSFFLNCL
jgi:hypothetical protein